jgi:hypothetical protein
MNTRSASSRVSSELSIVESVAPIGFGPPLHVHHDEHEAFYVLEGELDITCGGERFRAASGFAFLPRGVAHTFRVAGDRPARFLTVASPGRFEGFFRSVGRPAEGPGLPPREEVDIAGLREVGERFNVEIVGPPLGAGDRRTGVPSGVLAADLLHDPGIRGFGIDPAACGDLGGEQLAGLPVELGLARRARSSAGPGRQAALPLHAVPDDLRQPVHAPSGQLLLGEPVTPRPRLDGRRHVCAQRPLDLRQLPLAGHAAERVACPLERERHLQPALEG